jgi:hypothetical protein
MTATEPALPFPARALPARTRNRYPLDPQRLCHLFILVRPEAAICRDQRRDSVELSTVMRETLRQLRGIRWIAREHGIAGDESALHLIEQHLASELGGLAHLPSSDHGRLRFKEAEHLLAGRDLLPVQDSSLGLTHDALQQRLEPVELVTQTCRLLPVDA